MPRHCHASAHASCEASPRLSLEVRGGTSACERAGSRPSAGISMSSHRSSASTSASPVGAAGRVGERGVGVLAAGTTVGLTLSGRSSGMYLRALPHALRQRARWSAHGTANGRILTPKRDVPVSGEGYSAPRAQRFNASRCDRAGRQARLVVPQRCGRAPDRRRTRAALGGPSTLECHKE